MLLSHDLRVYQRPPRWRETRWVSVHLSGGKLHERRNAQASKRVTVPSAEDTGLSVWWRCGRPAHSWSHHRASSQGPAQAHAAAPALAEPISYLSGSQCERSVTALQSKLLPQ